MLESNVLSLELLQALGVIGLHATVLSLPAVRRPLGDLEMAAELGDVLALVQQLVTLGEFSDHLLGGVVPLFHGSSLLHSEIGTLTGSGSFQRDPRTVILIPPTVPGRIGDLELPADLGHVVTLVEHLLAFGEFSDHLFGSVTPLLHCCPLRSILEHQDSHY